MTTDRTPTPDHDAERRQALAPIGATWPNGWTARKITAYAMAVRDLLPDEVVAGVDETLRTWSGMGAPPPAEVRKHALAARERYGAQARRAAPVGSGQGCPDCRHEGISGDWVCDPKSRVVHCRTHSVGWRGVLPESLEDLGVMPEDEVAKQVDRLIGKLELERRMHRDRRDKRERDEWDEAW